MRRLLVTHPLDQFLIDNLWRHAVVTGMSAIKGEDDLSPMRTTAGNLAVIFCTVAIGISSHAQNLRGYVDMHTHPMSYLGFGGKAVHGVPDIGGLIPVGTRDCNENESSRLDKASLG